MSDPAAYTSLLEHFAHYFDAVDGRDIDAVMGVLDGAAITSGDVTTTDPSAVRAFYELRQPAPLPDGRRLTKHHLTNLTITEPDDHGVRVARVYYFRLEPGSDRPTVAASGRLEQHVVRHGTRWRVLRHVIISDF